MPHFRRQPRKPIQVSLPTELHPLERRLLLSTTAHLLAKPIEAASAILLPAKDKQKATPADASVGPDGTLTLNGTAGDDTIIISTNGSKTTVVLNGAAADFADSSFSALVVNGLAGNDSISIGQGVIGATLNGGAGNDTLQAGTNADVFNGGTGIDTVDYSNRTTDLTVTLGGGAVSGANGEGDTLASDIENVVGGSGNDSLIGNAADNILSGGAGDDTLIGNDGDDTLIGGIGNDTMDGKLGADVFEGGAGFDSADYRFRTEDLTLKIDGKADSGAGGAKEGDEIDTDVERIVGGSGDDLILGSNAACSLDGRDGNDTIIGGSGNDSIDGGNGDDSLVGNDGNDVLTGQAGNDTLIGGNGDDTFIANDAEADTLDGGAGNDTATVDPTLDTVTNIESGNIPAPDITVTDNGNALSDNFARVDFGSVNQGGTGPTQTFTIVNSGNTTLTLGSITVPVGFSLVDVPGAMVAPGDHTTFTVRLDASTVGAKTGQISFATNVSNKNPFNFTVTGSVVVPQLPQLTVLLAGATLANGAPVNFGSVTAGGTPVSRTFTVRNDGVATLTLGSLTVPTGFSVTDPLAASLGPGASDTFTVQLDANAVGVPAGPITFTTNDPAAPSFSIAIAGSVAAAPAPIIAVSQGTTDIPDNSTAVIDFGNVLAGQTAPSLTFTITNSGTARLRLGTVTVPTGFTLVTAPATSILPGATTTFVVQLNSSAAASEYSGQISFATNDPLVNPFTINVHGTVVSAAQPHLSAFLVGRRGRLSAVSVDQTLNFGSVLVGAASPTLTFDLRNDGTANLYFGQIAAPTGFRIVAGPATGLRLKPGGMISLTIAMLTTVAGNPSATVTIPTNESSENAFSFNVTGSVATPTPQLAVSLVRARRRVSAMVSGGSLNFGTVSQGAAAPGYTFVVANVGTARLRTSTISLPDGFVLTKGVARYLYPGVSDTLIVSMSTATTGFKGGTLSLFSSDVNNSPYNIAISGQVNAAVGSGSAVTSVFADGTLTVTGTDAADDILIGGSTRAVTVTANGHTVGGPYRGITKIVVDAGAGDDRVTLAVPINGTLNGEDGNDTLTGGPGNDVINGGSGNDVLNGGDGNDVLLGGDGDDAITGGAGVDVLKGEAGNDTLNAVDGIADSLIDGGLGNDIVHKDRVDPWTGT